MPNQTPQPPDLYTLARPILQGDPAMGKGRLAARLGVKTPTARRMIERYRGETQGHSQHPDYQRVLQLKQQHPDWGAHRLAAALGLTLDHAKLHLARWLGAQSQVSATTRISGAPSLAATPAPPSDAPNAGSTLQDATNKDSRDLCYRGTQIHTLEDLLVYAQVDTSVWEVERWVANKWEVGARNPATGEVLTAPLFQVKAWLRRRVVENTLKEISAELLKAFAEQAPTRAPIVRSSSGDGMLEIALFDLHYGKLAWVEECGHDYNPDVAAKLFWDAIEALLAKGAALKPSKILFPIGNDFLHTDIVGRTTTAGTPQDSAIVWKQAFVQGWQLLKRGIERLRQVAPVHVPVVSGNHDVMAAYHLGEVLQAHFGRTSDVTVDNSPTQRKYVTHHKCLLGLTHGSEERHAQLGMLMASERPVEWARSAPSAKEYHIGHLHHKKSLKLLPATDVGGVLVRVIPSLTGLDSWHASKGFVSQRAAEAYYWDADCGVTATFTHYPG